MSTEAAERELVGRTPTDRGEDPRQRRTEIIRAATSVLGRRGYSATPRKEIAREAGVAPGLLHYYFDSKEALLVGVVAELDAELAGSWAQAVTGIDDPLERLVAALDAAEQQSARHPERWRLLLDLYLLGLSNPAVRRRCQALRSRWVEAVETEVRQVLGRLPAYSIAPPGDLAATLSASIEGIAMGALIEARDPSAHFQVLKVMLLSLVVTAYVTAGQEPPVGQLARLLRRR
jgi:AcrR family transcriptional regulator